MTDNKNKPHIWPGALAEAAFVLVFWPILDRLVPPQSYHGVLYYLLCATIVGLLSFGVTYWRRARESQRPAS